MSLSRQDDSSMQLKSNSLANNGGHQGNSFVSNVNASGKARLQCHACSRYLEYDAGAQYVQCFSCTTMNAVQATTQVGGQVLCMICPVCHTTNLAPYGITYCRCGQCSTISQVSHAYRSDGLPINRQQQQSNPNPKNTHTNRIQQNVRLQSDKCQQNISRQNIQVPPNTDIDDTGYSETLTNNSDH